MRVQAGTVEPVPQNTSSGWGQVPKGGICSDYSQQVVVAVLRQVGTDSCESEI